MLATEPALASGVLQQPLLWGPGALPGPAPSPFLPLGKQKGQPDPSWGSNLLLRAQEEATSDGVRT